ncbi:MFS transporter, partial [Candidatus Roizmanbacteria bacterium]|nr:MFS transporter [Candidatus Roizmanbacteria bacterium]
FTGQSISMIGTWIQMIAQGWLVLQLTNSAFWVGVITAVGLLPVLIFSLFGGVIVDRYPKRSIMLITQTFSMALAILLGLLTIFQIVNPFLIALIAFLFGTVSALDTPARQAFVVEMVGRENLASALALNSGIFNGSRVIGPGVAGILIGLIGTGGAFVVNGISYIAVIIALYLIRVHENIPAEHAHPLEAIREGIRYSFSHTTIRILLLFAMITSIFGWSYFTIMPVIVKNIFHLDASGLGYLSSISGLGALLGTLVLSALARKIKPSVFIIGGSWLLSASLILFSFTRNAPTAAPFLFLIGFALIIQFATINTTIQHLVENTLRGRVMSIYVLMFMGMAPFGSFIIGLLAQHLGPQMAIQINTGVVLLFSLYMFSQRRRLQY